MGFAEIGGISVIVAFIAGLLSIASPCILPLIPAYLGYLTGASIETSPAKSGAPVPSQDVAGAGAKTQGTAAAIATPDHGQAAVANVSRPSPFLHAVSFTSGFSIVFILFGISLGIIGFFLRDPQDIIFKVSGSTLVILGLHLAGVITILWGAKMSSVSEGVEAASLSGQRYGSKFGRECWTRPQPIVDIVPPGARHCPHYIEELLGCPLYPRTIR